VLAEIVAQDDDRIILGSAGHEDAAVLRFPPGKALVQTVDFFTPIVNDPYSFGRIAAANALSDVYAMGGEPYSVMNIVCFPIKSMDKSVLKLILKGGYDTIREAGAVLAGGHSVDDPEVKYGLAVSGIIDPDSYAANKALAPGDLLVLTKPLGTGVLATAVKARWQGQDAFEQLLVRWAGRLNDKAAQVIRSLQLRAATDITGFGLGGHLLEMADASGMDVELWLDAVPFIDESLELASMGLLPAGSYANKDFCLKAVDFANGVGEDAKSLLRVDLVFDAQTSGGLLLAVPEARLDEARTMLESGGDIAAVVGRVTGPGDGRLRILPST
jgi:selenide,water dikinase